MDPAQTTPKSSSKNVLAMKYTGRSDGRCAAISFAGACDCSLRELYEAIGHDGSAVIWPDLLSPQNLANFHMEELMMGAVRLGFEPSMFHFMLATKPSPNSDVKVNIIDNSKFVVDLMTKSKGVLYGFGHKVMHCVYWDGHLIHCPNGPVYKFSDCNINFFKPKGYCKIKSFQK